MKLIKQFVILLFLTINFSYGNTNVIKNNILNNIEATTQNSNDNSIYLNINNIEIYKEIYLNNSFSGFISYKNKYRYLSYNSDVSCLVQLEIYSNYVYNKKVNVDVYRVLINDNSSLKYICSYNSSMNIDGTPQFYIYDIEQYIFKISTYDDGGTGGVEYVYNGYLNEIIDYDYCCIDCETNYTFGYKYNVEERYKEKDLNETILNDTELKDREKVEDTNKFPNYLIGNIESKNINSTSRGTGTLINKNMVLSCAHNFVSFYRTNNILYRHFKDRPYIYLGMNNNDFSNKHLFNKVYIQKEYFIYPESDDIFTNRHIDYDISISFIDYTYDYSFYNIELSYDNGGDLSEYKNINIIGYPGFEGIQYKSNVVKLKRDNNFIYVYYSDLSGGTSGSSLMNYKEGNIYTILGVHTISINKDTRYKGGTMITYKFWRFISYLRTNS